MGYNFKSVDRETAYLLPPNMREWLPANHLAWFIVDTVESLDLEKFYLAYRSDGWGRAAYEPKMMTALLLYSYCLGEQSSREIERACEVDVAFRVVAGNGRPDHTTICRFRSEHDGALKGLFLEVLRLCRKGGLVKAGAIALDGTKMKANAALSANRDYEHLKKDIDRWFEEAKAKDAQEDKLYGKDKRGDETPEAWATKEGRLKWLKEARTRLETEAAEDAAKQAAKIAQREAEEAATGKKKRGRKPGEPDDKPENDAKANVTDPQSRIMKTRSGYVQGYNAQAAVTENQIIVAAEVTQECNDVKQLLPMLEKIEANLAAVGAPEAMKTALADAGYWSDANMSAAKPMGPELFIATNKDWKQRKAMREAPVPRGRIPKAMTARERMERKLLTKWGRALYKLRGQTIEPTFGQIKDGRGLDGFSRRGVKAADSEWSLMCTTHNLLKLWRSGKAKIRRISGRFSLGTPTLAPVYA
jgi:transposase